MYCGSKIGQHLHRGLQQYRGTDMGIFINRLVEIRSRACADGVASLSIFPKPTPSHALGTPPPRAPRASPDLASIHSPRFRRANHIIIKHAPWTPKSQVTLLLPSCIPLSPDQRRRSVSRAPWPPRCGGARGPATSPRATSRTTSTSTTPRPTAAATTSSSLSAARSRPPRRPATPAPRPPPPTTRPTTPPRSPPHTRNTRSPTPPPAFVPSSSSRPMAAPATDPSLSPPTARRSRSPTAPATDQSPSQPTARRSRNPTAPAMDPNPSPSLPMASSPRRRSRSPTALAMDPSPSQPTASALRRRSSSLTAPATDPSPNPRRRTPMDLGTAERSRSRRRPTALVTDPVMGPEGSSRRKKATALGTAASRRPRRATVLDTGPATGVSRRWSRATDRSTGLATEGSHRWRRPMCRGMEARRRGERNMEVLGMEGRPRRRATVPRAMAGRLKSRAMVVLGMALVGTRSRSLMGRRLRVHMVMERRSPNIRVVGMRGQATAEERNTRGATAARSKMMTLMMKRRSTTTIAATTTMTKHPASSWSVRCCSGSMSIYCMNKDGLVCLLGTGSWVSPMSLHLFTPKL